MTRGENLKLWRVLWKKKHNSADNTVAKKNQIITGDFRYIKQNTYLNIIIYNIDSMVKYNWISIYLCKVANMGLTMTFLGMFIATKEE